MSSSLRVLRGAAVTNSAPVSAIALPNRSAQVGGAVSWSMTAILGFHPAVLGPPGVETGRAEAMLPAQLGNRHARVGLLDEPDDLLGGDVRMLPEVKGGNGYGIKPGSNPDFLINNEVFDAFAPKPKTPARNIWSVVQQKSITQSRRMVLNLDDYDGSMVDLVNQFNEYEIRTLDELLIFRNGELSRLKPR